jgi:CHAT domain-containing protein
MKSIRLVFTILLSVAISTQLIAQSAKDQKKFDKQLAKIDRTFNSGQYLKASSALTKFKKSITTKFGQSNSYMPGYYIREARTNLNLGILTGFDNSLTNAVNASFSLYGETSTKYASTLVEVGETYMQYGNYRVSREFLIRAKNIVIKANPADPVLMGRINLRLAHTYIGQGFCNQAITLLLDNEKHYASRAVEKEVYVEDGKIKNKTFSIEELNSRFNDYAEMLTLIGQAYAKQGKLNSADSAFASARTWISRNQRYMGETSLALVTVNFLNAKMLAENNDGKLPENVQRYLDFNNILSDLKSRTSSAVPLAHDVYLTYMDDLQRKNNLSRYASLRGEYEKSLQKNYSKSSLMVLNLKAIEFDAKLAKEQSKTIESDALSIINSKSLPRNYKTTIRIMEFLYQMSVTTKRYNGAEAYLNQIVEIKKELYGEESTEYNLAKILLANFYIDYTNKIDNARKIFDNSYTNMVAHEIGAWHKDHINILNHLAILYELSDNYLLANKTLDKALLLARAKYADNDVDFGVELDKIAQLQIKTGEYDKAEQNITRSLKILNEFRKDQTRMLDYVHAIETQARLFGIKGLFDEAQLNLDLSKKIIGKSKRHSGSLSSSEELASLLIQLGSYSATDELLNNLIPEYEKLYGANSLRLIEPLVHRGRILLARGDYAEAERVAQRANGIAVSIYSESSTKTANTQKLLSDIYYTLGDYEKAQDNIVKALVSQERQFSRNHIEVAKSLSHLALIKFHNGDNRNDVEKILIEARDIMANKLGKDNPQYAEIMKNISVFYISEKKYDIAFNSLTIAENIWRAKTGSKNNINTAAIFTLSGDVYYQLKNYKKAEEFYNRSKDLYEKSFSARHPEYVKLLSKLSKVYYMTKDYKKSKKYIEESLGNYEIFIKSYFPALSEREKAKYWNTIKGDFEFYNTLAFSNLEDFKDLTKKVYEYQLLTKALLLSSSIKIRERIQKSTDENLKNLYQGWQEKKDLMTVTLSMSANQLIENELDPIVLAQEVERIEKELSQKSELFSQGFDNKRISFDDIRKVLKPNEVAVELVRYRHFNHTFTDSIIYAAIYIRNEFKSPKALILGDGKKMETRYYKFYRNSMINKTYDNVSYNIFWAPIQKEIGLASTIYLSADGVYNLINLESIPTPDGKYILDNANIVLVSNTKDIYLNKVKSRATAFNTAYLVGNPQFYTSASVNGSIAPLPGTEKEISQLQFMFKQKGWDAKELIETNASEENLKELDNPKIFHIATHGFYKATEEITSDHEIEGNEAKLTQNPLLRTGLLLKGAGDLLNKTDYNYNMENGILTAYEAMNLSLEKTDLVVLSACETGLGEVEAGEGVFGLQRAFLVAGAKILVMSIFKVDDDATQKLMLKFYQKWLVSGNMRQSFIDAKKELRLEYTEPINWGAFMMIGIE